MEDVIRQKNQNNNDERRTWVLCTVVGRYSIINIINSINTINSISINSISNVALRVCNLGNGYFAFPWLFVEPTRALEPHTIATLLDLNGQLTYKFESLRVWGL